MARPSSRVVLITGAGASRDLGKTQLPLMRDWAESLSAALEDVESGLATSIGLEAEMSAEDFEEVLGAFIRWANDGLPLTKRFLRLGGPQPGSLDGAMNKWSQRTTDRIKSVVETLRASMYKEFGREAIDDNKARSAYEALLKHLDIQTGELVCATTNYDPSLQIGLSLAGHVVDDGFEGSRAWATPTLDVSGVVDWAKGNNNRVPLLHLHGAVGWYRREDGSITRQPPDQEYNPTLGTPVYLPPDPLKDPSNDANVAEIWSEFEDAIASATHVLILGHSLNDQPLTRTLTAVAQQASIAVVTLHADTELIRSKLPGALAVDARFGPEFDSEELRNWSSGIVELRSRVSH